MQYHFDRTDKKLKVCIHRSAECQTIEFPPYDNYDTNGKWLVGTRGTEEIVVHDLENPQIVKTAKLPQTGNIVLRVVVAQDCAYFMTAETPTHVTQKDAVFVYNCVLGEGPVKMTDAEPIYKVGHDSWLMPDALREYQESDYVGYRHNRQVFGFTLFSDDVEAFGSPYPFRIIEKTALVICIREVPSVFGYDDDENFEIVNLANDEVVVSRDCGFPLIESNGTAILLPNDAVVHNTLVKAAPCPLLQTVEGSAWWVLQ